MKVEEQQQCCEEAAQSKMKGWTFVPHAKGPDASAHRALLDAGSMAAAPNGSFSFKVRQRSSL
eukprot:SAG22_NODE_15363_length_350_cov_1.231076_1_plen_62_part_01